MTVAFLVAFLTVSNSDNFGIASQLLAHEISFPEFSSQYDTSVEATKVFIEKSDSANIDFEMKEGKGPLEFYAVVESTLSHVARGDLKSYQILKSMGEAVDGYIADDYSGYIRKYCNRYPAKFKTLVIKEGKNSSLLAQFLYDSGGGWESEPFFQHKSKHNAKIVEWVRANIEEENAR